MVAPRAQASLGGPFLGTGEESSWSFEFASFLVQLLPGQPERDFSQPTSRPLGYQGKGLGAWGQGWQEPSEWASFWGGQLDTSATTASAGPRQGEEGAAVYLLLPGIGCRGC